MRKSKGITLIALVITIVILIILAGVAINLTLGENGIFRKAEEAKKKDSESAAREKVELVLVDASIEKGTNTAYNKENFLDDMLEQNGITVEGDIVISNNYTFLIDREKLEIVESLGETLIKLETEVQKYLGANENGKYEVSVLVTVESNTELQSVVITNLDGTTREVVSEGTQAFKTLNIELDETYTITATTVDGKVGTRNLIEKSIENIRTAEELVDFRDKVNTGLTYEGKTINVVKEIDLSSVCGANINGEEISWIPIGDYATNTINIFKGTFNGNNYTINNIYINSSKNYQGLFGCNEGIIQNIKVNGNIIISTGATTGGIAAYNLKNIINCHNNVKITGYYAVGGIAGRIEMTSTVEKCSNTNEIYATYSDVGGIVGGGHGVIKESYNTGYVHTSGSTAGGIGGFVLSGSLYNCYNSGSIYASQIVGGINGAAGNQGFSACYSYNCYNIGTVNGGSYVGSITGWPNANGGSSADVNCYTTNATVDLLNAGSYSDNVWTDDVKIKVINEETGLEEEVWKYNNGYPILKWQLGE